MCPTGAGLSHVGCQPLTCGCAAHGHASWWARFFSRMLGGVTRVLEMKHVSSHIRVPGAGLGGAEVTSFTYCPRVY